MASTRRFCISDTATQSMSTQQYHHHGAASHTASSSTTTSPPSATSVPPRQSANTMALDQSAPSRSTQAYCRNCRCKIGDFYNSWHRVTGTYYAPAMLGSYATSLKITGKPKPASRGTDVEACTIQLLSCPHPGCADTPIGFTVVAAPAGKTKFRGRDFFKLSRIELQCQIAPGKTIVVEPHEDIAPDLAAAPEDTPSPYSPTCPPRPSSSEAMEVDSRMPSLHQLVYSRSPLGLRYDHDQDSGKQQSVYRFETDRQSLRTLPPPSVPSPPPANVSHSTFQTVQSKALPPLSPVAEPVREVDAPQQKAPAVHSTTVLPESQAHVSKSQFSPEAPQTNGHQYPRLPGAISMDAFQRLQTQVSQNSGALAAHTRDIRRSEESSQHLEETLRREFQDQLFRQSADIQKIEESAARLQHEMQSMRHAMECMSREMEAWRLEKQSRKSALSPSLQLNAQDSTLELMAQQIAVMSHKTSDLDNLKLHIEIMKNKIYHLEEGAKAALSQPPPHLYQSQRETGVAPSHPSTPTLPQGSDPTRRISNVQHDQPSFGQPPSKTAVEAMQRHEPLPSQNNGWAAINAGVKRSSHSGMNSPQEAATTHGPSSPKRQKLGDAESFARYTASQATLNLAVAEGTDGRLSTPAHTTASQPPLYSPYTPQYWPLEDAMRSDSQSMIESHRARGRGRGGGPGSRGGRVRKSMLGQPHGVYGMSEWESDEWQGLRSSQGSPDDFHSHMARSGRGGIARRGSGGSGARGGYVTSDRAASLGLQGVAAGISFGPPGEIYGSAKRTRTKPVRNADGVLIRKDGRPDMRSQSSAANLRKVHARKEQESSHSPTPTNTQYAASVGATDTPSPAGFAVPPNATDKHKAIMGKIFPEGLDASRKQHDFARQVFAEDCDHTIHSRSHNHRPAAKAVKEEQSEHNGRVDKGPNSPRQDVDDRGAEERVDDHGEEHEDSQTPDESHQQQPEEGDETAAEPVAEATGEQNNSVAVSRAGSETQGVESSVADEGDCIHVKAH